MSFGEMFAKGGVKEKPKKVYTPRTPKPKTDYEKFILRNLDKLKDALHESIKQYQGKKYPKSKTNVKRYRQIFWKLIKIEKEVDK